MRQGGNIPEAITTKDEANSSTSTNATKVVEVTKVEAEQVEHLTREVAVSLQEVVSFFEDYGCWQELQGRLVEARSRNMFLTELVQQQQRWPMVLSNLCRRLAMEAREGREGRENREGRVNRENREGRESSTVPRELLARLRDSQGLVAR